MEGLSCFLCYSRNATDTIRHVTIILVLCAPGDWLSIFFFFSHLQFSIRHTQGDSYTCCCRIFIAALLLFLCFAPLFSPPRTHSALCALRTRTHCKIRVLFVELLARARAENMCDVVRCTISVCFAIVDSIFNYCFRKAYSQTSTHKKVGNSRTHGMET